MKGSAIGETNERTHTLTTATSWFRVVDQRNGEPVTDANYFTADQAQYDIDEWWARFHRGGRPDISRDLLLNLQVRREDSE